MITFNIQVFFSLIQTRWVYESGFFYFYGNTYISALNKKIMSRTLETKLAVAEGTLTSAQILALFTTGIDLIPSPGAGKAIIPSQIVMKLRFNSVAYTIVGVTSFVLQYKAGVDITANMQTLLDDAASGILVPIPLLIQDTVANIANKAIEAKVEGANPAAGNSVIDWKILYHIIETGEPTY